jgi:hypothetical protein
MGFLAMIDYNGRRFAADHDPSAVGHYRQCADLVWARFAGGAIRSGRLVGTADADGVITAAYGQVLSSGDVVAGTCVSTPTLLADGRVRLREQWQRADGTHGVSEIEECPERSTDDDHER